MFKIKLLSTLPSLTIQAETPTTRGQFPFLAIVTYGGRASDQPVGGTETIKGGPYNVVVPTKLLEAKIAELVGKPVLAAESLDSHAHSVTVGEFMQAWTETAEDANGEPVTVAKASGILSRSKDPELVDEIVALARKGVMGFSYDLKEVEFNVKAGSGSSDSFVELTSFKWRGATVLRRDAAAYEQTQLAAQQIQRKEEEQNEMENETMKKAITDAIIAAVADLKEKVLDPFKTEITASVATIQAEVADVKGKQVAAAAAPAPKETPAPVVVPPPATPPASISLAEFTASIGEAIKASITPVLDELKASIVAAKPTVPEPVSFRKSLTAAELQVVGRFDSLKDEKEELTVEGLTAALAAISADNGITKSEKMHLCANLGGVRRRLIRTNSGAAA